jgi:RND family efflux transporter MFP subunit
MKMKRYASVIVGGLFLILAVALWGMPNHEQGPSDSTDATRVKIDRVRMETSRRIGRFAGVTQARNRAVLSFAVPARVVHRYVDTGSKVTLGDTLARLDDGEFRNAVQMARASMMELTTQWKQAGRDRKRIETLAASDVIPVSDLERAVAREAALEAAVTAAAAKLKESRRLLGETVMKAPFSATVSRLHIQPGEWAVPGQPVVELTGDGDIELLVEVPETVVSHFAAGQAVQIQLPFADNRKVFGRIGSVAKAAMAGGRLFPVKVDIAPAAGLTAGMTAELLITLATEGVLTVPLASVINPGASQPFVFVFVNGRVSRRPVTLGRIVEDRIIVHGDLSETDQVVTTGQSMLGDGDVVEVVS